jgi:hypothetical protein
MAEEKKAPDTVTEVGEKKVMARVLRDFWPTDDDRDRVKAGTEVEVTMEALLDGMEKGVLERVK